MWHSHKWTDWAVIDKGKTTFCGDPVGWYIVQERRCLTCGKTQFSDQAEYAEHGSKWCHRRSEMPSRAPRKDGVSA